MRDHIAFLLNGAPVRLGGFEPSMTVLQYLREQAGLKGTKEGCAEGDCGACTAVVADIWDGAVRYRPVNTCIQFLASLDGKALITVDGLDSDGAPHPVQRAMVDMHASQCGFCTPGFVMSLFAGYQNHADSDRRSIDDLLAGNLCRCTGYRPIIAAAKRALSSRLNDGLSRSDAGLRAAIEALDCTEDVEIERDGRRFLAPTTADALAELLQQFPGARLVAGATDLGLLVTKQHQRPACLISVVRVPELQDIRLVEGGLLIGAAATYERAASHLAALYPDMAELIRRIGGIQVRAFGTIGGNIGNGSPIGDMPPALIAAGATIKLRSSAGSRDLALEDYFIEYGRQDRLDTEFIESIFVPTPAENTILRLYKISKRFDQDISAVCAAFQFCFEKVSPHRRITRARLAFGGMAGTPIRARRCEAFLVGRVLDERTVEEATAVLDACYQPISDWRASSRYRRQVAANLLRKVALELANKTRFQLAGRSGEVDHAWTGP